MWLLWSFCAVLFCCQQAFATGIVVKPSEVSGLPNATLSCNFTNPDTPIKSHYWTRNGKIIDGTKKDGPANFMEYVIQKVAEKSGRYSCVFETDKLNEEFIDVKAPPHVTAHKPSENANENDKAKLVCDCHSYPLITGGWTWDKITEEGSMNITNGTGRYIIQSTPSNSTLIIDDLVNEDAGDYECRGENELGESRAKVQLRVRSRLAALWPFLGIVVEVIILVTIIFIYEKRRKPDEINDDDDSGSAPLKSNSATNHKDKNVRQRNSN